LNHPSLAWVNGRLSRVVQYPIVSVVHHLRSSEAHPPIQSTIYRSVESRYLRSVSGFIFNSRTTRAAVDAMLPGTQPGIVAYPAADHISAPEVEAVLAQRRSIIRQSGPLRIIFVGNIIRRKGLHLLLHALRRLPAGSWQLDVVGNATVDPSYAAMIRGLVDANSWQGAVHLHGSVSDEELRRKLEASHVLAVPSYEGFGIVYLEAMAFGLPPIASTAGAAHEIVEHTHSGFLVSPDDQAGLAHALIQLNEDRDLLLTMSIAARRRYEEHPTWRESMGTAVQWLEERVADAKSRVG
jgi:glycosyltransferase involved in cell wall biosynthesis